MNILNIVSSPRGDQSFSIKLADAIIGKLLEDTPGSTVTTRDLATNPFPHLEAAKLQSLFTPAPDRTPEQQLAAKHSDDAIAEVQAADIIVIGAPLYNFGIPSVLKAWIDHICRAGITFKYVNGQPQGLVTGKKVYIAMASGGIYSEGPAASNDFVAPYLQAVLSFIGLTDVTVVRVEGVSIPGLQDTALAKALATLQPELADEAI
ncbi:NAD(P)H-dependent oxidoreductase [Hymenobacter aerilatus]|uniref:FMN dependent NADH:quinone oxidoreductase n=1 Tax=Hymenobacter aerilatus TaxID=2932251 RepID=A0A8T9SUS0_9BACT|nr:NAD(P)H-dependent oxidoreductase [Hymenobacter aerilatus]UOR05517.1 NAD(P)H-dependent oxidoreductase [Hymenobacter aerilatus]